ncbi:MAG: hypothetical protein ABIK15_17590 [Pseudomonadota bacterium]
MAWSMKKIERLTRILCDIRPERPVDTAYLYCRTREDQESVFQAARFLLHNSFAHEIWIPPLRAFMTAVTLALEEFPELRIYSFPGSALSWQAEVTHSQGKLKADRRSLIHEELLRIAVYQDKGDLALFDPVLQYLNQRDEGAKKRKNG